MNVKRISASHCMFHAVMLSVSLSVCVSAGAGKKLKAKNTLVEKSEGANSIFKRQKSNIFAKTWHKNGDAFLKYGFQATAYDFAYSSRDDFEGRKWGHLGIFAVGGVSGAFADRYFINNDFWRENTFGNIGRSGMGALAYGLDYTISGFIKKRFDGFKDDGNKLSIFSAKWIEQSFTNFLKTP